MRKMFLFRLKTKLQTVHQQHQSKKKKKKKKCERHENERKKKVFIHSIIQYHLKNEKGERIALPVMESRQDVYLHLLQLLGVFQCIVLQ